MDGHQQQRCNDRGQRRQQEGSCEEYLACFTVRTADNTRCKELQNELDYDFLKGKDTYSKKMEDALRLMQNHKSVPVKTAGRGKARDRNQAQSKRQMMMRMG
jgi:hypothetical protein